MIGWLKIPLAFPGAVEQWNDNHMIPQLYFWGLVFAGFAIVKRRGLIKLTATAARVSCWIIGCMPFVILWVWPWQSAYVAHYFYIFAVAFLFFCVGGKTWIRVILPSLIFLLMCPGLPAGVNEYIILRLQDYCSWIGFVYCKCALSWDYVKDGHMLFLPWADGIISSGGRPRVAIKIAEECSGFGSLVGMGLLGLFYGINPELRLLKKVTLFAFAIGLAVGFNTLRIFISSTFIHYGLKNLTSAVPHSLLGHILMGVEIVILYIVSGRMYSGAKKGVDKNATTHKTA